MAFVYIAQAGNGLVKIGHARDVERRLRLLRTGCPFPLELVYKQPCEEVRRVEAEVHRRLKAWRFNGEWFQVGLAQAVETLQMAALGIEQRKEQESMTIIIPEQSRAARALLGLGTDAVSKEAGIGINTLQRFERGDQHMNLQTLQKLVAAYSRLGIEFPDTRTVRRKREREREAA